jgi:hypothetical protein
MSQPDLTGVSQLVPECAFTKYSIKYYSFMTIVLLMNNTELANKVLLDLYTVSYVLPGLST